MPFGCWLVCYVSTSHSAILQRYIVTWQLSSFQTSRLLQARCIPTYTIFYFNFDKIRTTVWYTQRKFAKSLEKKLISVRKEIQNVVGTEDWTYASWNSWNHSAMAPYMIWWLIRWLASKTVKDVNFSVRFALLNLLKGLCYRWRDIGTPSCQKSTIAELSLYDALSPQIKFQSFHAMHIRFRNTLCAFHWGCWKWS